MKKRSREAKRRIVEESLESGVTVVNVAGKHGVRLGQIFEWRPAYKGGRLAAEPTGQALLSVRLSDVSRPVRQLSAAGSIYIELSNARTEIHGAADAVSVGIVLEWLAQ